MVGTYEERRIGNMMVSLEFFKRYRQIVEIRNQYIQEHRKECEKFENFNLRKLHKLTKEIGKMNNLKKKLEKEYGIDD